jgi:predicted peptidase
MGFKAKIILSFFAVILCGVACSDSFLETNQEAVIEPTSELDVEKANKDFSELPFKTGINDFEISVLFNQRWRFRLIVPEVTDDELVPLFINLHGGALTPRPEGFKRGDCLLGPALETENIKAYILSPTSEALLWFHPFNEAQVVNLVRFSIEHLKVDPKRVVVFGYSDGGFGSWFFADTHPELFSAAIPMAQAYGLISTDNGIAKKTEIPLYVIHGEIDALFPFSNTEALVERSRNSGSEIEFVKAAGLNHNRACDYIPYVEDAIEWVKTSVWE